MGYTHSWIAKAATKESWYEFYMKCKELYEALPKTSETAGGFYNDDKIEIVGEHDGDCEPQINEHFVMFNGKGELGHEDFYVTKVGHDGFCKTDRKPYDLLVCACLLAAVDVLDYDLDITNGDLDDWQPAIDLYLDTIYDVQTMDQDEKNELVQEVLPEVFLKEI